MLDPQKLTPEGLYALQSDTWAEGVAWERKRIESEWQIERFECQCESPMDHLLERIEGEK